ncbi:IST1 homolog isoform X1 [Oryctolagus cuniculus]|uniref:IST1 homolog n=1 Tax=Oryctolagus cuniculus TaxID=9986 RepID=G1TR80_RABIT|nr:IST1 homolog [Oryctolagus cuniculus]XP_051702944.1 IST1 homolog [Oryctolagus cuniculus]
MFSSAFKADRLRVNLQLVINRLKVLEKKKTEQTQKARKEIADYLAAGKDERARIRVEHVIREDYLVEAMEILELYCDLLLARFSLIHATKQLDPGLAESVSTLIWAAPRLQSEVPELKIVSNQLCAKYSQQYGQLCQTNEIGTVNSQLMYKLNLSTLPPTLVEEYLTEIAKNYNVPYKHKAAIVAKAPADLDGTGLTEDVEKDALGKERGTVAGTGDPLEASASALGPLPGPSPCLPSFPPERQNNEGKKDDSLSPLPPYPGLNPPTSHKPESGAQIGFDKFMLPKLSGVKLQASLFIDPYDSEEVDFEDLNRRLEMLKKTT